MSDTPIGRRPNIIQRALARVVAAKNAVLEWAGFGK